MATQAAASSSASTSDGAEGLMRGHRMAILMGGETSDQSHTATADLLEALPCDCDRRDESFLCFVSPNCQSP